MASVSAWSALLLVACASASEPPHEAPKTAPDPWAATAPAPERKPSSKNTDDCSAILSDGDAKALGYTRRLGECTDFQHSLELTENGRTVAHVSVIHGMDKQVMFDRPLADAKASAARNDPTATHTLSENIGLGDESFLLETHLVPAGKLAANEAKALGIAMPVQIKLVAQKGDYSLEVDANNLATAGDSRIAGTVPAAPTATAVKIATHVLSKL